MNTARTGFLDEQHAELSGFEAMRTFARLLIRPVPQGHRLPDGDTAFGMAWSGRPVHLLSNQPWAEPLSLHPMTPAYVVCHELSAWGGKLLGALP
ncbi:hypothetical protein QFZ24_000182 [Streptomyces phaeochromogenes]|jgi:hypothetical protein|nr:hypothetical protein [Streptomyces phaeochromogenes]